MTRRAKPKRCGGSVARKYGLWRHDLPDGEPCRCGSYETCELCGQAHVLVERCALCGTTGQLPLWRISA